jgi:hypothetical protein
MRCPVCGGSVTRITRHGFPGLSVACPRDGKFSVVRTALPEFLGLAQPDREAQLQKAAAHATMAGFDIPVISTVEPAIRQYS